MTLSRRQLLAGAAATAAVAAMPAVASAALEEAPVAASTGWTPLIASAVSDGKVVVTVTEWFGGTGPKPPVTYIGENGVVLDPVDAAEIFQMRECI